MESNLLKFTKCLIGWATAAIETMEETTMKYNDEILPYFIFLIFCLLNTDILHLILIYLDVLIYIETFK